MAHSWAKWQKIRQKFRFKKFEKLIGHTLELVSLGARYTNSNTIVMSILLGGHFATLCLEFDFYEVKGKKYCYFSKRKSKYFYTFNHFYSEKSSKRAK